jgi:hypothetical protein
MHAKDLGVPQDYATAHMWFNLSAAHAEYPEPVTRQPWSDKSNRSDVVLDRLRAMRRPSTIIRQTCTV